MTPSLSLPSREEQMPKSMRDVRLSAIERALKLDPNPEYRRQLIKEYLDLWERIDEIDF